MIWHSMTFPELYCLITRQRRTIKAMALLIIITFAAAAWGAHSRDNTIRDLQALRMANDSEINMLASRILELEQEAEAKAKESAIKTSRGADRTAIVTAYTWTGQQTASGTWPKEGRTVAGPRWIPFGTRVYIDGIGWRIVEDRTHERYDGRYDVYMDDYGQCMEWGKQERVVRFE